MAEPLTLDRPDPQAGDRWIAPDLVEPVGGTWRLVGTTCEACGATFFPATNMCAFCLGTELKRVHFPRLGVLHSVTTVSLAPPGFEAPYSLGWVIVASSRQSDS